MKQTKETISALFLFNHKFEPNVAKLESIYADRFSRRRYIMPFATSVDEKVLPVHESSYTFSGHLSQARARILEDDVTHYVIISDDLILSPALDETNIISALGLTASSGYIKSLAALDDVRYRWWRALVIINDFMRTESYFDFKAELPPIAETKARFETLGLRFQKPIPRSLAEWRFALGRFPRKLRRIGKPVSYPFLCGYSDFFVVPGASMERFLHFCGVFAALNIFAEVAVPTALALAVGDIVTELRIGELFDDPNATRSPDARLRGVEFWQPGESEAFAARFGNDMIRLKAEFPSSWLYVHPVKLSRWR